jgi:hypothetical protein
LRIGALESAQLELQALPDSASLVTEQEQNANGVATALRNAQNAFRINHKNTYWECLAWSSALKEQ